LAEPYGPLVRETLQAAGLPWSGLDGRPVAESLPGRALLGLLRLPERDFARADVIAALGAMPALPDGVSLGQWDRLSRQARVVRGESQWRARLGWPAAEKPEAAAGLEHADGTGARPGHRR